MLVSVIVPLIGGLMLFFYGLHIMTVGMQNAAGSGVRILLNRFMSNRFFALFSGFFVTLLTQSSSATMVLLASFLKNKLVAFRQAFPAILGAGIGTTITVQLIVFRLADYSLLLVSLGIILYLFINNSSVKQLGFGILGFGLLFYGMFLMSGAITPLKTNEAFINWITHFSNPFLGIFVGLIATAVIQSSGATIGICIILAQQGLLSFEQSVPIMLGANLGTVSTIAIASIEGGRNALKITVGELITKLTGVAFILLVLPYFSAFVINTSHWFSIQNVDRIIANSHTIFNLFIALLFLPFTNWAAKIIDHWFIENSKPDEMAEKHIYIDFKTTESPFLAMNIAKQSLIKQFELTKEMLHLTSLTFQYKDNSSYLKAKAYEDIIDSNYTLINDYILNVMGRQVDKNLSTEAYHLMSVSKELEQIADIMDVHILALSNKHI